MKLGEKAKGAAIELVKQQAARDVLAAINKWRSSRISTANRRWIFELIQNAVDAAKARKKEKLIITLDYDGNSLVFRHNAGYFTFAELDSLIYGTSSKPWGPESEYLGRFGTGFLVSHIVSRTVRIAGLVKDDSGDVYRFDLEINREGNSIEKISDSIEDCFKQLDDAKPEAPETEDWTTYTYSLHDSSGNTAVAEGINQLKQNAPFLLAFNPISEIAIGADHFARQSVEDIGDVTKVNVGDKRVYFIDSKDKSSVQVGVLCDMKGIIDMADRPSIFIGMPVTESAERVRLPFVLNNLRFETTPDRDSLENNQSNVQSLEIGFNLYLRLLSSLLSLEEGSEWWNLFRLIQFQPVPDNELAQNPLWITFNRLLNETFQKVISDLSLVKTINGLKTVKSTVFPYRKFDGKEMSDSDFAKFCELIKTMGKTIPDLRELNDWISTAQQLQACFQNDVTLYSVVDLKKEIEQSVLSDSGLPDFEDIAKNLNLEDSNTFLQSFYDLIDSLYAIKMVSLDFIMNLLPDQTGVVGPVKRKWSGTGINFQLQLEDEKEPLPEELKKIVTKIGKPIRDELVDREYSKFLIVKDYVHETITIEKLITEIIANANYCLPEKLTALDQDQVIGWIELFRWCVINKRLANGFLVITKDFGTVKVEEVKKETILMPFSVLNIAQKFEEIYPDSKILNNAYLNANEEEKAKFLNSLCDYGAFILNLPSHKTELNFSFEKLKSVLVPPCDQVSKVDHVVRANESSGSISYLPFWNEVVGRISDFRDRAKLLLSFVLEYLAKEDKNWRNSIEVECTCKEKTHTILPALWLASLKTDAWVPIKGEENGEEKSVKMSASKENIEALFEPLEFEQMIAADPNLAMDLLPHFNFDRLDLRIKLYSLRMGALESDVRDEASNLVELVGKVDAEDIKKIAQNPQAFQQAVADMEKTLEDQQIKEENKVVGQNIEMIMRKIINDEGLGLLAKPIYVGGDIEIWPESSEGNDGGEIEIAPYVVEVKSTSGTRVHLSKAQSELAHVTKNNYMVLVVEDTNGLRERLKVKIDEDNIPGDLVTLLVERSHVVEEIHLKLGNFPNPDEVEADIHGYWVKRKLWEQKSDVHEWLKENFEPVRHEP